MLPRVLVFKEITASGPAKGKPKHYEKTPPPITYEPATKPLPKPIERLRGYDKLQTCQFPILDPFDLSIEKFVQHPSPLRCEPVHPKLTYVRANAVYVNATLMLRHNASKFGFRYFWRPTGSDSALQFGEWSDITWVQPGSDLEPYEPTRFQLDRAGAEIKGTYHGTDGRRRIYTEIYASVAPSATGTTKKRVFAERRPSAKTYKPLNVLIFGLDSISRSNFFRNLPLTHRVLTQKMGGWIMRGYSKIDDNTFPNMMALLSGHRVTIHDKELDVDIQNDYVDDWPLIWRNFSDHGYVTMLSEEQPGVFSYKAKGFRKAPTDVYMRPYGSVMNNMDLSRMSSPHCIGSVPEAMRFMETLERFMQVHRERPHMIFSFLWKLSHDKSHLIEKIDPYIAQWFEKLFTSGMLAHTAVFVMGDHGNRFDTIRSTLIGRYEERMPFLYVHLPDWFRRDNAHVEAALDENVWKLSCQYDVYETLVDILHRDYGTDRETLYNRGTSLFRAISKERSCADVDIPEHFCVCQVDEPVSIDEEIVQLAASHVVQRMNDQFLANFSHICQQVTLENVLSAQRFGANVNVTHNNRWHWDKLMGDTNVTNIVQTLRVTFKAQPNDALFEALVRVTLPLEDSQATDALLSTSMGDVSRINAYGHNGDCISHIDRNLERFCACAR